MLLSRYINFLIILIFFTKYMIEMDTRTLINVNTMPAQNLPKNGVMTGTMRCS